MSSPPSAIPLPLPLSFPLALPPPPPSRRIPPPCWSHDETVALIDAYRDKWYSLGRGNLKSNHWQDVADAVNTLCLNSSSAKTAIQCRHKMEKLRKRYRTEIQRARSLPNSRFNSSWVHYGRMHSMEKGPSPIKPGNDSDNEDQDLIFDNGFRSAHTRGFEKLYRNGNGIGDGDSGGPAFRVRVPTMAHARSKFNGKAGDHKLNQNPNPSPSFGKGKRERGDPLGEMVSAIKMLGDGFVRMEQMKMEMAREIQAMRMEMELNRTQMILESQHRIVEAFANAVSEKQKNKKARRMPPSP